MAEIDKNKLGELKKVVGFDEVGEHSKKDVKIIKDKKQFSIRIPKKFAKAVKINETEDHFEFHLIPHEDDEEFDLEAILVKG